jgi:hypothetical protein
LPGTCRLDAEGIEKEILAWVAHRCASVCSAAALFPPSLRAWNEQHAAQSASMLSSVAKSMSDTAPAQSTRTACKPPAVLQSPSAQFLSAVVQLQNMCRQCAKQHLESLAEHGSASTKKHSSIPWNMVHAIAVLGESLLESHYSLLHIGTDQVPHTSLASLRCVRYVP